MAVHEEFIPKVAQFLSHTNKVIALVGGTAIASATTLATAQSALTALIAPATEHESDGRIIERYVSQALPRANTLGIFTDTDIAAANDTATWRSGITQYDSRLPAAYEASLEDD